MSILLEQDQEHTFLTELAELCTRHRVKIVVRHCCCGSVEFRQLESGQKVDHDTCLEEN